MAPRTTRTRSKPARPVERNERLERQRPEPDERALEVVARCPACGEPFFASGFVREAALHYAARHRAHD
jgi:hypothetical protein